MRRVLTGIGNGRQFVLIGSGGAKQYFQGIVRKFAQAIFDRFAGSKVFVEPLLKIKLIQKRRQFQEHTGGVSVSRNRKMIVRALIIMRSQNDLAQVV